MGPIWIPQAESLLNVVDEGSIRQSLEGNPSFASHMAGTLVLPKLTVVSGFTNTKISALYVVSANFFRPQSALPSNLKDIYGSSTLKRAWDGMSATYKGSIQFHVV